MKGVEKMPEIAKNDDISILPLSVRSCNCLRSVEIDTIGAMLDYPDEHLLSIRNMGTKSAEEVRHWIRVLQNGLDGYTLVEWREAPPATKAETTSVCADTAQETAFVDKNGAIMEDLRIADTTLSVRAKNALNNGGVEYVSQLAKLTEPELMGFKNMGHKSVAEILAYIAEVEVTYHAASNSQMEQLSEEYREIVSQMIRFFGQGESTWVQALMEIQEAYPEVCGETLLYRLYDKPFVKATVKATILHLVEKNGGEISKSSLAEQLPSHLGNTTIVEELLLELESSCALEIGEVMVVRQYPSIVQFVAQLTDTRQREVLEARLAGKTLQEIGDQNDGLSREWIRQISNKGLAKKPRLREDQYAYLYDNYDFSEEDFSLAFDEPKETYNYLEMVSTKSRSKRMPIIDLLTDTSVPAMLRRKAERAVYKQYVTIDGVRVKKQRADLVKYFVKTLCKTLTKLDDFVTFYHLQLEELGLAGDPSLQIESRTYVNILNSCDYALWNQWRSFRYYNIPEYDFEALLTTIDLESLNNTEISSLKLFRDYPDLMAEYDIHDEYELHNLLKKVWKKGTVEVKFKRMPTIEIGSASAEEQCLSLLIQYAPIAADELAQRYEEEYGVKADTVRGYYLRKLDHYFYNGVYSIDYDALPLDQFAQMKQVLVQNYYTIEDAKRLYLREFPDSDDSCINPYTLKTLGFHVYPGYVGYIVKNTFSGATDFFHTLLTEKDIVDMRQKDASIRRIATYTSELYRVRGDYEIVEFAPLQYIHIRRLRAAGVEKEDLRNYCRAVGAFYEKGDYFTITSLRKAGFVHELDDLGFDEWFFASVLMEDNVRFSCQRIGGTRVFLCGKPGANLGDMLVWLLERHRKIDFYDLMEWLENDYGIVLPKEKLLSIIDGANLYYDTIMEAVYIDYDTYFEEI